MHSAVQTAVVTIIRYKPLSGLNFARYTEQYGSYMPSSPLGVYKPLVKYYTLSQYMHADTGTVLTTMTVTVVNSTLGRMCVSFTNGINTGVIENDQTFTVSLQGPGNIGSPISEWRDCHSANLGERE